MPNRNPRSSAARRAPLASAAGRPAVRAGDPRRGHRLRAAESPGADDRRPRRCQQQRSRRLQRSVPDAGDRTRLPLQRLTAKRRHCRRTRSDSSSNASGSQGLAAALRTDRESPSRFRRRLPGRHLSPSEHTHAEAQVPRVPVRSLRADRDRDHRAGLLCDGRAAAGGGDRGVRRGADAEGPELRARAQHLRDHQGLRAGSLLHPRVLVAGDHGLQGLDAAPRRGAARHGPAEAARGHEDPARGFARLRAAGRGAAARAARANCCRARC